MVLLLIIIRAIFFCIIMRKRCVFLLQTPMHGNLGDHAIAEAEKKLIQDILPDRVFVELPSSIIKRMPHFVHYIVGKNPVLIHGGGFLGDLWHRESDIVANIVSMFPQNRIIIFPQTMYYDYNEQRKSSFKRDIMLFGKHKDIWIFLREKVSYEFCIKTFPAVHAMLVPDIVFYLNGITAKPSSQGILLCLRDDSEKVLSDDNENELYNILHSRFPQQKIIRTDTIGSSFISPGKRGDLVNELISDFSRARLVITDRLHGMIFSAISKTPCIAFGSVSHKTKGVYEWLKNFNGIIYIDDFSDINSAIDQLLCAESYDFNLEELRLEFKPLIELLTDTYKSSINQ